MNFVIFRFFVRLGTSRYPIVPGGKVAMSFVVFCRIVAQVYGLSLVNASIKLNVVRNMTEK